MYNKLTTSTSTPSPPVKRLPLPHPHHRALNTFSLLRPAPPPTEPTLPLRARLITIRELSPHTPALITCCGTWVPRWKYADVGKARLSYALACGRRIAL
ncbi:hypothetical protein HBI56_148910 [Parastagonospora nodorum]|uniref:Uncharacterized protein n=1 Tax=Phaeosphaeria nodorum (strain SN15 / ATCC MYA-4574 / FGSC 10173) TaxID=321614 RepID=Q0U678_PHANO|nr:hypothetical protein SNOG_12736 [Parastagonospora nodorum SN15]KAH3915536.1 hypothetical protein HBH56_075950 [Parastagonospora nodorum]EAT80034.1 hypothetical protein SNOG_12736 [Parastagonospora nodorum SN15]KAH3927340.1 hypothetical protein HBH54_156190 [Parastagonospora nodorum]KAH3952157.1 hypothetical protein HBH53_052200 [Parastagonospora nodorum]KAH3981681.1 hypothetical protein HBH51_042900 [Parastagonospora nodorum]